MLYRILLIHALWFLFRCNKYGKYLIGHPQIITENFAPLSEYFGLVKCSVLPPRSLYHPVLPYRTQGKLMFPLCRTCADTLQQEPCCHNDSDRALHGTWVTLELQRLWKRVTSCSNSTRCGTSLSTLMVSSKTTWIRF